jgi:hypothetical protein
LTWASRACAGYKPETQISAKTFIYRYRAQTGGSLQPCSMTIRGSRGAHRRFAPTGT